MLARRPSYTYSKYNGDACALLWSRDTGSDTTGPEENSYLLNKMPTEDCWCHPMGQEKKCRHL